MSIGTKWMDIWCRQNFCSWGECTERVAKKCFQIKSFFAVFCCKFRLEIRGKKLGFCLLQLFINFPIWMFYRMEVIGRRAINGAFRWLRWWSSGNWPIRRSVGADSCHTIPHLTKPNHIIQYHIISYHIISYHIIPYHTIPYLTISYHATPHWT